MVHDFHTHTILSDGDLLPIELIRRAIVRGYRVIGITDHVSASNIRTVIPALIADCRLAEKHWDIRAIPGVELTHLPPGGIAELAAEASKLGAELVVVHGETPAEPVQEGTNLAALNCPEVDVLAHPGPISAETAELAARNGIYLEISSRRGHSLANGAVVAAGRQAGAGFLINSDSHSPSDILTDDWQLRVAQSAGLSASEIDVALRANPRQLLAKIDARRRA